VLNTDCECPAGKGPYATCKHVAAVLLMICSFVDSGNIEKELHGKSSDISLAKAPI
jgi:uncharacterized Zn finger protein